MIPLWLAQDRLSKSFSGFNEGWDSGALLLWLSVIVIIGVAAVAGWYFLMILKKQKDFRDSHQLFYDMIQRLGLSATERSLIILMAEQQKVHNIIEYFVRSSLWNEWINRNAQSDYLALAEGLREKIFGKL